MEQRPLRLGDILDDYCPRERRVTNHVVGAMIEEEVRQTRCTTCDAEHAYKGGKAPRRRKTADAAVAPAAPAAVVARPAEIVANESDDAQPEAQDAAPTEPAAADDAPIPDELLADEGPVHRPLIRATLPRPEGIKIERPLPEFTIRQNGRGGNGNARGGFAAKGRGGHGGHGGHGQGGHSQGGHSQGMNGGGRPGNGSRFGRGPQGPGRSQGRGGAAPGGFNRGPKKRSR